MIGILSMLGAIIAFGYIAWILEEILRGINKILAKLEEDEWRTD